MAQPLSFGCRGKYQIFVLLHSKGLDPVLIVSRTANTPGLVIICTSSTILCHRHVLVFQFFVRDNKCAGISIICHRHVMLFQLLSRDMCWYFNSLSETCAGISMFCQRHVLVFKFFVIDMCWYFNSLS